MYTPRAFGSVEPSEVRELVAAVGAADLVTATPRLSATRLPIHWGDDDIVRCHLARANPQWQQLRAGEPVLLIIGGPQAYISPAYYPSKVEHGRVVPTWDYEVVHLHGTIRVIDDADAARSIVNLLTEVHERRRLHPWHLADAPAEYVEAQLRAIVAIEVTVTQVEASFKLSQNKSAADIAGVAETLGASTDAQERHVAELVAKHAPR